MDYAFTLKSLIQVKRLQMKKLDLADRNVFVKNLTFTYHVMRASENLLRVGMVGGDKLLAAYYAQHLDEERGHADWLAADMISLGHDFSAIPREAMLMAGMQYYMMFHVSSVSMLGYMAALECFPTPIGVIEKLEELHGKEALRTMRYHAEIDLKHGDELLAFINLRPAKDHAAITEAAMQACHYMNEAFKLMETCNGD